MNDLAELYHAVILEHGKKPRNERAIEGAEHMALGHNPLCGDRVTVFVHTDGDRIADVSFTGSGCAICTASASLMTQHVKDMTKADAERCHEAFHELLTDDAAEPDETVLGKLVALAGVRAYPIRVKCATLPWHTLMSALEDDGATASTE